MTDTNRSGSAGVAPTTAATSSGDTLADVIGRLAASPGSLIFMDGGDGRPSELRLRHGELAEAASRAAAALRDRGVNPGDRVCLLGPTSPDLVISLFGAWRAGAIPVVLPPVRKRQPEELARRLQVVEARALVTGAEYAGLIEAAQLRARVVRFDDLTAGGSGDAGPVACGPGDLALVQFTSGSTARPRGVTLTHANVLYNCGASAEAAGMEAGQTWISWLPLYHDMGVITMIAATTLGASMLLETPEHFVNRPGSWLDSAARHGCYGTPTPTFGLRLATMDLKLNPRRLDLSSLRTIITGAEQVDADTLEAFTAATAPAGLSARALCPAYGLAEATLAVTISRPDEPVVSYTVHSEGLEPGAEVRTAAPGTPGTRRLTSCGRPLAGTAVEVVDGDGRPLPPWRVGEIVVRSPSVMVGYWSAPDATAEVIGEDGRLHTGDLGFLADGGDLVVCGRIKDMIIVGGHNLYPEEYESAAQRVDGVRGGGVVAFSVPEIERMVVVVEMSHHCDDLEGLAREVMSALREDLAHAPEEVAVVRPGSVPRTTSGKLQRRLCCRLYASGQMPVVAVARRQGG